MGLRRRVAQWLEARGHDLLLVAVETLRGQAVDWREVTDGEGLTRENFVALGIANEEHMRLVLALGMARTRCAGCGEPVKVDSCSRVSEPRMIDSLVTVCCNPECERTAEQVVFTPPVSVEAAVVVGALRAVALGEVS